MKIIVDCRGHGLGYNFYDITFEFNSNYNKYEYETNEYVRDEIYETSLRLAKIKTACQCVTIKHIDII
jgi:hypothetical protein